MGMGRLRSRWMASRGRPRLTDVYKAAATFNRFGILNQQTTGGSIEAYYDDIVLGEAEKLIRIRSGGGGNQWSTRIRSAGSPTISRPSAKTNFAGAGAGEVGGLLWRDDKGCWQDKGGRSRWMMSFTPAEKRDSPTRVQMAGITKVSNAKPRRPSFAVSTRELANILAIHRGPQPHRPLLQPDLRQLPQRSD